MKKIILRMLILLALLPVSQVFADYPKVSKLSDGWFRQHHDRVNVYYLYDSKIKTCFVKSSASGLSVISCSALKNRKEWEEILEDY